MSTQRRRYQLKARAERQAETRRRIVEATVALHQELGPARTTVAEIARRAGVERLTVYNHFPREGALFAACQVRFLEQHPAPDVDSALALAEPRARVQAALEALYRSYRERAPMTAKVMRDRSLLPALDELLAATIDAQLNELKAALAAPYRVRGRRRRQLHATLALALDFCTWQRLDQEGLSDAEKAELITDFVEAVGEIGRG